MGALEEESERSLQLTDDQLDKILEGELVAGRLVLVVQVLDELGNDLCVRLRLELVSLTGLRSESSIKNEDN